VRYVDDKRKKVLVYKGYVDDVPFFMLGDYAPTRSAPGCDTIPKISTLTDLAIQYANKNDGRSIVFLEGLLAGHSWGELGERLHPAFGHRYVNAFLDTPVERCLRRVLKRRESKGTETPPERLAKISQNVQDDYHRVELCYDRVIARGGFRIDVPWRGAPEFCERYISGNAP